MKLPQDTSLATAFIDTPVGKMRAAATDRGLCVLLFPNKETAWPKKEGSAKARRHLAETRKALADYFAGTRKEFSDIALDMQGTDFQRSVWSALLTIPFGETRSYGDIARQIGNPKAVRAVGLANGQNPVPVIVPCHRVIGANGKLTGFGGGIETKQWLLAHEDTKKSLNGEMLLPL
ncbi:methylated-DNA-[protein]-cysteine S-methyltransferase [Parvibaculum indicum]|uniref:methylated-DNA--[protein]-cysteine S-methyltransferase n=1 Tax=Parvibaculum indicum TaxID=562969 RepID=UPI00142284F6|nr:methylated-DNA--[protein]-cysteine S-methyltransferase [Parvibaculum indicum]NIJ42113.1 methylated-DNA-[protein]-cysteine S-methyltransferase [Parvibaculum indicum]